MVNAAALILAGGKSSRLGRDKAFERVNQYGMLENAIITLADCFPEIIVGANDEAYGSLGKKVVPDYYAGRGPLGGIHAVLKASSFETNFLVACDMPFINVDLALYLVSLASGYDAVIPRQGVYFQQLFSVYNKSCLPAVERQLESGRNKVASFFEQVNVRFVEVTDLQQFGSPDKIFFNVNTGDDLLRAKVLAKENNNGRQG